LWFFSQKLTPAQARYSAFDRELLAVHEAILHFRHLLEGRSFIVYTDHLPLVGALHRVSEPKSDRQRRQLSFIAEFTAEIRHIAGTSHVVADTLSRPAAAPSNTYVVAGAAVPSSTSGPLAGLAATAAAAGLHLLRSGPQAELTAGVATAGLPHQSSTSPRVAGAVAATAAVTGPPLDVADIAEAQPACPDCQRAVHVLSLKVVAAEMAGKQLLVDTSFGVLRPLVPVPFPPDSSMLSTTWLIRASELQGG
jgi:RNase H-like domain found in reverse transcriptase